LNDTQNAEGAQFFLRMKSILGTWLSCMFKGPTADSILCLACENICQGGIGNGTLPRCQNNLNI